MTQCPSAHWYGQPRRRESVCYSVQVQSDYKKFVVMFGATMSIRDFHESMLKSAASARRRIRATQTGLRLLQAMAERTTVMAKSSKATALSCAPIARRAGSHMPTTTRSSNEACRARIGA